MRVLFYVFFVFLFAHCSTQKKETKQPVKVTKSHLEVYCFHGTRQCETCKNMKANTRITLEEYFSKELKDSTIVFSVIDVDDPLNEAIAEKFEATGTALMVNWVNQGKDSIVDWSEFAFEKANNQSEYVQELNVKISEIIK